MIPQSGGMKQYQEEKDMKKIVTTEAPAAIGPYSQGMVFGDMVFSSGRIRLSLTVRKKRQPKAWLLNCDSRKMEKIPGRSSTIFTAVRSFTTFRESLPGTMA